MKTKLIKGVIEKLNLVGNENEAIISGELMRLSSKGLKVFAAALGVEVDATEEKVVETDKAE